MSGGGLSSANFMSGLSDGINTAIGIDRYETNKARTEKADARADEVYELGLADRDRTIQRQNKQDKQQDDLFQINMDDASRKRQLQGLNALAAQAMAIESGGGLDKLPDDMKQFIQSNSLFNVDNLLSDEMGQALETADGVVRGKYKITSPEASQAANVLLRDGLNKGSPGNKTIDFMVPGQNKGTLMLGLNVDQESVVTKAPLTERRSADPDDPVKEIPVNAVMQKVQGIKMYRKLLSTPQGRKYIIDYAKAMSGQSPDVTYGDIQTDPVSGVAGQFDSKGQFHQVGGKGGQGAAYRWHNLSNDTSNIQDPNNPENTLDVIHQYNDDGTTRTIDMATGKPIAFKPKYRTPSDKALSELMKGNVTPDQYLEAFGPEALKKAMEQQQKPGTDESGAEASPSKGSPSDAELLSQLGINSQQAAEARIVQINKDLHGMGRTQGGGNDVAKRKALIEELALLERAINPGRVASGRNAQLDPGALFGVTPEMYAGTKS